MTSQDIVSEEMIRSNPIEYLHYKPISPPLDHERLEIMEQALSEVL